jgi:hypothetical protein
MASWQSWFADRTVVIATMHRKEQAIAPLLEEALGVRVILPPSFNTDEFGTFTRDIPRAGSQREAARRKAEAALALTGETLAIASEGAFIPHPALPWISCNRELVLLIDRQHQLELVGEVVSTETNHAHQSVRSVEDALRFAEKAGFPDHGLVVMPQAQGSDPDSIVKGIRSVDGLIAYVETYLKQSSTGTVHLETDMRAMHNPTRMQVIAQATQKLLEAIASPCPECGAPGFTVVEHIPGLPCGLCGSPTTQIYKSRLACQRCSTTREVMFPNQITFADPAQCPYCNP